MPIVILLDDSIYLSNENILLKTPGNRFLTKCLKIAKKSTKNLAVDDELYNT